MPIAGQKLSLRCPGCGNIGSFEPIDLIYDISVPMTTTVLGQRVCPNPECRTHVFCILTLQGKIIRSYPPERIHFESGSIPEPIAKTFSEAIACHGEQLYVAAGIMIRRALEELCEDKHADGKTLQERIQSLRSIVVLPPDLFEGLDDLRLLGNDATHVESKTYKSVGREEVEIGIELTKEILKAVYQLGGLIERMRALKK